MQMLMYLGSNAQQAEWESLLPKSLLQIHQSAGQIWLQTSKVAPYYKSTN